MPTATREPAVKRSSNRSRVFVGASEIAGLINLHPYVKVSDAIERLWEKNHKRSFIEALARNQLSSFTSEERLKSIGLLEAADSVVGTGGQEVYKQRLENVIRQASTTQDRSVIRDYVHTARGTKFEKTTFEVLQMQNPSGELQSDDKLYQQLIHVPRSNVEYLVSGYIDGIELQNHRVIEIKSRQNRLFGHVPLYEQVQCQAYLFLTGLKICEHTESFEGKIKTTTLNYEQLFWDEVIRQLNAVVLAFSAMLGDPAYQDHFLRTGSLDEECKRKRRTTSRYIVKRAPGTND
jgi:hypothetical protein